MKQISKFLFLLAVNASIFTSCSNDDDVLPLSLPLGDYENGYFILNEGGFDTMTSSISYIAEDGTQTDDVFRIENPSEGEIGTFLQHIFFDDTRLFVVAGSTGTVAVYNRYTFEFITKITTDLENPRYGVVLNGKAYVTNSNDFFTNTDDSVTVIDLNDYTTSSIVVGDYANTITAHNGNLYIMNGPFADNPTISVLNPTTEAVTPIDLGTGNAPNSMLIQGNTLVVLTNGQQIVGIDLSTNQITSTIDIPTSLASPKNLDLENGVIYFTSGTSVYSFGINETTISTTPIATYTSTSAFGSMYGFNVENDIIHIGDAGDFNSDGQVFEYSLDGALLESRTVDGFSPNGFYFN